MWREIQLGFANRLVMDALKDLEDSRKCWRLVNGVLFEKTKAEVIPEMKQVVDNMENVLQQLGDTLVFKKQEIVRLE